MSIAIVNHWCQKYLAECYYTRVHKIISLGLYHSAEERTQNHAQERYTDHTQQLVPALPDRGAQLAEIPLPGRPGTVRLEFVACQPHPEAATDLVFNREDVTGRRDRIIRRIAEPLGHSVEAKGLTASFGADGSAFYGDVVGVEPPLGINTLISISANLGANMGIANGYFENNPRLD
jgi:hypothetical protein